MNSLRARLLAFLFSLAALVALVTGALTYRSVLREADQLFDYQLRQMALSLRDQGAIVGQERAALADEALDFVIQVWSRDGSVTYSSRDRAGLPPRAVLGFADVDFDGQAWRVYSTAASGRVIQVAQPLAVRRALAADAAWRSVLPLLVAAPVVALAVWWLVGFSLAPLRRLVTAVRARDAGALAPLELHGLPTEITPLAAALNALLERLRASFATQRAFVADAAHELRSPLTALRLQLDLLRRAPEPTQRDQALAALGTGMDRLQHLVEQLLVLARAEPGGGEVVLQEVDLAEVARQALADAVPLAAARGSEVELRADAPVAVRGEADALRILVRNLVDNAVRYAGSGAQIRVSVSGEGDTAVVQVDDSGPGIPPAERERVFDRFYRHQGSSHVGSDQGGSGLGRAIVRTIAQRHEASVTLGEAPLGGLRAEVRLPRGASRPGAPLILA